jgi:acetyl-CoA carboxylase biotin carboxyl carrier protein
VSADAANATGNGNSDSEDRLTIARLTSEVVPTLIERLSRSALGELEVREQGWRIRLRRPADLNGHAPGGPVVTASSQPTGRSAQSSHHEPRPAHREPRRDVIASPAVGYFSPRDGIEAGASVRGGDTIGHVDVLGVRVDVVVGVDGKLSKLDVESGEAVEYGQPIAHLEPATATRPADV